MFRIPVEDQSRQQQGAENSCRYQFQPLDEPFGEDRRER
jgi:hypothetical protein